LLHIHDFSITNPMTSLRRQRVAVLMGATALSVLLTVPGSAQTTPEQDYAEYIQRVEALGLDASNDGVSYDAANDRLVIQNDRLELSGSFPSPDGSSPADALSYTLTFAAGTTTIDGLDESDGTFSAQNWTYSDDARLVITADLPDEGRGTFEFRFVDTALTNYSFEVPSIPAADPDRRASRWLDFARSTLESSFDSITIGATALTMEVYETSETSEELVFSATGQLNGYRSQNSVDGRVGEYSLDSFVQNTLTRNEATGEMMAQTLRYGETVYKDVNASAFLDLFDPSVPETGDRVTLTGSQIIRGYESRQDLGNGMAVEISGGEAIVDNVYAIKRDFDFLGLLDRAFAGEEPRPEDIIHGALQLYRSFGVDNAQINDLAISFPDPSDASTLYEAEISELGMTEIGSDGIGSMHVAGLSAPSLPQGASFSLDLASLGDIEFADYGPIREMIVKLVNDPAFAEQNPLEVARAFTPRSFGVTVEGLDVNIPGQGEIGLDLYEMDMATTVPPIPTLIEMRTDNLTLPISAIDDADVRSALEGLGLETITWSDETILSWDEDTQDLTLERLYLSVEDLGTLEGSLRFANVPRAAFEDPEGQGQMALVMASFVEAEFSFTDEGLLDRGLAFASKDADIPEGVMAAAFIEQAVGATAFFQNEALTEMTRDAVTEFFNEGGAIRVSVKPVNAVPLAQILGSMAAPQALPDLLNMQISAE